MDAWARQRVAQPYLLQPAVRAQIVNVCMGAWPYAPLPGVEPPSAHVRVHMSAWSYLLLPEVEPPLVLAHGHVRVAGMFGVHPGSGIRMQITSSFTSKTKRQMAEITK